MAVSYDGDPSSTGDYTFYWTRVSDSFTVANSLGNFGDITSDAVANSANLFGVGSLARDPWRLQVLGKVDEVRISSVVRTANQFIFGVPEPTSFSLLLFGSMLLCRIWRKRG